MRNIKLMVIFSAVVLIFAMSTHTALAGPIRWKSQCMWGSGELMYKTFVDFCKNVEKMTNGRLVIEPLPGGTIVSNFQLLDALRDNMVQAINSAGVYSSHKDPGAAVFTDLLYGYNAPWEAEAWFYYGGGKELFNEFYNRFGVTCIGVIMWGFESFPAKFPIMSMADYKGHTFRSPQGMTLDTLAKLGAKAVYLRSWEIYSALEKGIVDGADWGTPSMNVRLGLNQVCKYFIFPEFRSMPMSDFSVNTKAWNKLPDDIKTIIEIAVRAWGQETLQQAHIEDYKAILKWESKGGKACKWKKEDIEAMRDFVRQNVWPEWAQKSPFAKKVIDSQLKFLKRIGTIK